MGYSQQVCEDDQSFLVQEEAKRVAASAKHVEAKVELAAVEEVRIKEIPARHPYTASKY